MPVTTTTTTSGLTTSALPICRGQPSQHRCRCATVNICEAGQTCTIFLCLSPCPTPPQTAKETCACGLLRCTNGQVCNAALMRCHTPPPCRLPPSVNTDMCVCGNTHCSIGEICEGDICVGACPAAPTKTTGVCVCGSALCQKDQTCNAVGTECTSDCPAPPESARQACTCGSSVCVKNQICEVSASRCVVPTSSSTSLHTLSSSRLSTRTRVNSTSHVTTPTSGRHSSVAGGRLVVSVS